MKTNRTHASTLLALFFFTWLPATSQISYLNQGQFYVDNEAFFPIGFYCEGLPFDAFTDIPQKMSDAGFNIIYTESTVGNVSDYSSFLNACEDLGLKNIIGLPYSFIDPEDFTFYVNTLKTYPSIISWNMLDDANNLTVDDLELQKENLLALDTSRVTSASWYNVAEPFAQMLPIVEMVGMQAYPWEDASENDLVFVNDLFRSTVLECQSAERFPFATPQACNWEGETYPSAAHLDCQTYLGFITGMKGALFYTFKDYDANETIDISQPDIFNAASSIAAEILSTEWKQVLLFGDHSYVNIDYYRYYATWEWNGYLYLIAVNASDEETYSYAMALPPYVMGEAENFFDYRPDALSIDNGFLTGELAPYQVAIYKMETSLLSSDHMLKNELNLFPNPAIDKLSFYIPDHLLQGFVEIRDLTGRLAFSGKAIAGINSISISQLSSGYHTLTCYFKNTETIFQSNFFHVK